MRQDAKSKDLADRIFQGLAGALMLFLLVPVVFGISADLWRWAIFGVQREDTSFAVVLLALAPWLFGYAFRMLRGRGEEQSMRPSMPPRRMIAVGSVLIAAMSWFAVWHADLGNSETRRAIAAGILIGAIAVITGVLRRKT